MVNIVFSDKKKNFKKMKIKKSRKTKKMVIWSHVTVMLLVIFGYISLKTAFILSLTRYFISSGKLSTCGVKTSQ